MVLQDSVEASSDMRDAGDVCLDEVWEDGMLSVSAWLGPCSQSISTSCSSANKLPWGGGGGLAPSQMNTAPQASQNQTSCQSCDAVRGIAHLSAGEGHWERRWAVSVTTCTSGGQGNVSVDGQVSCVLVTGGQLAGQRLQVL